MWSLILSALPWSKVFELSFNLISRAIKHSDDLNQLEKDWLEFTKNINRTVPVKLSEDAKKAIAILEEKERQEDAKINHLKEKVETYKESNKVLYSKNLELEDKLNKTKNFYNREF